MSGKLQASAFRKNYARHSFLCRAWKINSRQFIWTLQIVKIMVDVVSDHYLEVRGEHSS
uniref:Uncharacterized protein LOC8279198 isoform X1 n=1 Tax=Rhizophora mucronata TaxID=61149 RepID=A0A2P2J8Z4_RHIMU